MCGIAGIFAYHPSARSVNRVELTAIRDHMEARGPDGSGEWYSADGRLGFGHRRLAIIDLTEGGAQPMVSGDGRYIITFNGEIYNYRELKRSLQAQGRVFISDSDTEVLLHLFALKGEAMLHDLRGMFTLGIWDTRERSLFLARDAFGIKPLYYADDGKTIRFASQVKALLKGSVDTAPEPAGHVGFFLWGSVPAPWTLYRGIRSLAAGHCLRASATGVTISEWTSVRSILQHSARQAVKGSRVDALEEIAASIERSVAAHMVADVPVGVFLSSGLDSCMLASSAQKHAASVHAVTLGFKEFARSNNDEVPLAQQVAAALGLQHDVYTAARPDFLSQRAALLAAMDQPSIDGVNTWFVSQAAAKCGLKVVLSGLGGDELFASYPSFTDVPRINRMARPLAGFPAFGRSARAAMAPFASRFASPKFASLFEYGGTVGGAYFLRRALMMPWELDTVLDRDIVREGLERLQTMPTLNALVDDIDEDRLQVSSLEMASYMRHQLLRDTDWASMAHSLELRVPFVDAHLLREAVPWLAAYPDITKGQVAQAVAPSLPARIWSRPKTGFGVPVREWITADLPDDKARGLRGWAERVFRVQTASDPATTSNLVFHGRPGPARVRSVQPTRVLVSSIAPGSGGVNAMVEFVVQVLKSEGFEPVIAHYEPYSVTPRLSVPSFRLLTQTVKQEARVSHGDVETHAIGAWLPELEFTHYLPTSAWRRVMDSCDAFVVASGNSLAGTPFHHTQRQYLAWIATDWWGDRADRTKHFPRLRLLLDRYFNRTVIMRLEKRLLKGGVTLALSQHTKRELVRIQPHLSADILPVPVSTARFMPKQGATAVARIGFAGRYDDPRKNIDLLFSAFSLIAAQRPDAVLSLIGGVDTAATRSRAAQHGLVDNIQIAGRLNDAEYVEALQRLDVFVVPSHQEGLCIAALEAMACGVPVVSTRCGGPEEFVEDGVTGFQCAFDATELADKVLRIVTHRTLRAQLGDGARARVEGQYSPEYAKEVLLRGFYSAFPQLGRATAVVGNVATMARALNAKRSPTKDTLR